jgi:hypothetical protein
MKRERSISEIRSAVLGRIARSSGAVYNPDRDGLATGMHAGVMCAPIGVYRSRPRGGSSVRPRSRTRAFVGGLFVAGIVAGCNADDTPKPSQQPVIKTSPGAKPETPVKEMKPPETKVAEGKTPPSTPVGDIAPLEPPGSAKDEPGDVKPK